MWGPIPELVGVSELRVRYREVFEKIKRAPVILAQRSQAVAVLVSPELWNRLLERLEELEDALSVVEARERGEPLTRLEDYLAERGARV